MVWRFVLFFLVFDHIVSYFMFICAELTHIDKQQHHFHRDRHRHRWVYYVVIQKYSFKVCVISFDFHSTHYKVYIHLPCIITQQQTTAPFDSTRVLLSSDLWKPRLYQGSADFCEGDRNSDVICLLPPSLTIRYCNQSVLTIFPDLNILVWSIKIFGLISRSALVQYFSITW